MFEQTVDTYNLEPDRKVRNYYGSLPYKMNDFRTNWKSYANARYIEGICLGILILCVVLSAFILITREIDNAFLELENYFFASIAIAGVYFTVRVVREQIYQQIESSESRIGQRRLVGLSTLSMTSVSFYEKSLEITEWYLSPIGNPPNLRSDFLNEIRELSSFVEYCDKEESRFILALLSSLQVLTSRLAANSTTMAQDYHSTTDTINIYQLNADGEAMNWAIIALMAKRVLQFSREPVCGMGSIDFSHEEILRTIDDSWIKDYEVRTTPDSVFRIRQKLEFRGSSDAHIPEFFRW